MARLIRSDRRTEEARTAGGAHVPGRAVRSARSMARPGTAARTETVLRDRTAGRARTASSRQDATAASAKLSASASSSRAPSGILARRRRRSASSQTMTRLLHRFGRDMLAALVLLACMLGSLWMRTQMVQDSFTVSKLDTSIAMLRQDVEDRQTRLDALNAELPEKACKLGLVVSDTSVQVDLTQPAASSSKDSQ